MIILSQNLSRTVIKTLKLNYFFVIQDHAPISNGRQACKKHELYVSFRDLGWKVKTYLQYAFLHTQWVFKYQANESESDIYNMFRHGFTGNIITKVLFQHTYQD